MTRKPRVPPRAPRKRTSAWDPDAESVVGLAPSMSTGMESVKTSSGPSVPGERLAPPTAMMRRRRKLWSPGDGRQARERRN
ncbi:hypothetical protein K3495_g323 [Podosphaera aphanis]|nr:hypothetical protein K3495_g323 [Podosphaera aphanis]